MTDQQVTACRNALFVSDPGFDRKRAISATGTRVEGTCEWIKLNEHYRTWLRGNSNDDSRLLLITGGAGTGKMMLSIFLTYELERHTARMDNTDLIFFFCRNNDEARDTKISVLRSLVHQIITKRPQLIKHVLPFFETLKSAQDALSSMYILWIIFGKLITDEGLGMMFCVLDELDQCKDGDLSSQLAAIHGHPWIKGSFRLLLVRRDNSELEKFPRIIVNNKSIFNDIRLLASARVDELAKIEGFNEEFRHSMETALIQRAGGKFLWVSVAMKVLSQKQTRTEVWEALQHLPTSLPAMYRYILQSIPTEQNTISRTILLWVSMAQRPLGWLELADAADTKPLGPPFCDAISYLKPLLEIKNDEVWPIHRSVRDAILHDFPSVPPKLFRCDPFRFDPKQAHLEILQACLDCVARNTLGDGPQTANGTPNLQESPLMRYVMAHWAAHVGGCSPIGDKLVHRFRSFFDPHYFTRRGWWTAYSNWGCTESSEALPLLHILCYLGYDVLLLDALSWDESKSGSLERVNCGDSNGRTALHVAAEEGKVAIVKALIDYKAYVDARNKTGQTALHIASWRGDEAVAGLLVKNGADVNAKDNNGQTPLPRTIAGAAHVRDRLALEQARKDALMGVSQTDNP